MYLLSKDASFIHVPGRVTRTVDKIVFKVPTRIKPIYERSPYYVGTLLWTELSQYTQEANLIFEVKKIIGRMYQTYKSM